MGNLDDLTEKKLNAGKPRPRKKTKSTKSPVTAVTPVTSTNDAGLAVTASNCDTGDSGDSYDDSQDTTAYPPESARPCYFVHEDWLTKPDGDKLRPGVYRHLVRVDEKSGGTELIDLWISSPLYVDAVTKDQHGNNYGRYLRFKAQRGGWRAWCMPMAMLKGSGDELRGELLNMGVQFNVQDRKALINYLTFEDPTETLEIATQTGWHKGAFVLPEQCIGSDKYFYQSDYFQTDVPYRQSGTLADWQREIAHYCVDNPLLMLSVSAAFAGALLKPAHTTGGGFHLYGASSKGKSTSLFAGCSVWGDTSYKRSWKATSNGMEATATMFNDSLLALDEISECDAREVGIIVYALGNGIGKQRANRNGGSRAAYQWRVMVLSNGERSIEDAILEAGKTAKAGQSLRLLSIPIFGNYGAFDCLHDKKDGRELSDHLQTAAAKFYGVAGVEFLKKLVSETRSIDALAEQFTADLIGNQSLSSQEQRAAKRFALVALAGELATGYGVTGWQTGQATAAIAECFKKWRDSFGGGDAEDRQILQSVKDFIDRFGDSRFSGIGGDNSTKVIDRAGYMTDTGGERVFLFNDYGFKTALAGYDAKRGAVVLKKHGWLICDSGRLNKQQRINGKQERFYWIKPVSDSDLSPLSPVEKNEVVTDETAIGAAVTSVTAVTGEKTMFKNISENDWQTLLAYLAAIGETDPDEIAAVLAECESSPEHLTAYLANAEKS